MLQPPQNLSKQKKNFYLVYQVKKKCGHRDHPLRTRTKQYYDNAQLDYKKGTYFTHYPKLGREENKQYCLCKYPNK